MQKETQKKGLLLADLEILHSEKPDEFIKLAKGFNGLQGKLKKAQEIYKESHQDNGKVIHVLKTDWITNRGKGVRSSQTYAEFHESVTGDRPTGRGCQCAAVFGLLVVTAKELTEEQYDDCMSEYVTEAAVILGKAGEKLDHPAVKEVIRILRRHAKTALKELKAIKARFVTRLEGEGDDIKEVTVFLSEEEAKEQEGKLGILEASVKADEVAKANPGALIAALDALVRITDSEETAKLVATGIAKIPEAFAANVDAEKKRRFSEETVSGWYAASAGPLQIRTPGNALKRVMEIGAELALGNQDEDNLRNIFGALYVALNRCGTPEQQNAWLMEENERNSVLALAETAEPATADKKSRKKAA